MNAKFVFYLSFSHHVHISFVWPEDLVNICKKYKDRSLVVKVWLHCSKKETSHFRTMMKQCIAPLLTVQVHIHSEIKMEKSTIQDCAIAKNAIHHSEAAPLDFF